MNVPGRPWLSEFCIPICSLRHVEVVFAYRMALDLLYRSLNTNDIIWKQNKKKIEKTGFSVLYGRFQQDMPCIKMTNPFHHEIHHRPPRIYAYCVKQTHARFRLPSPLFSVFVLAKQHSRHYIIPFMTRPARARDTALLSLRWPSPSPFFKRQIKVGLDGQGCGCGATPWTGVSQLVPSLTRLPGPRFGFSLLASLPRSPPTPHSWCRMAFSQRSRGARWGSTVVHKRVSKGGGSRYVRNRSSRKSSR